MRYIAELKKHSLLLMCLLHRPDCASSWLPLKLVADCHRDSKFDFPNGTTIGSTVSDHTKTTATPQLTQPRADSFIEKNPTMQSFFLHKLHLEEMEPEEFVRITTKKKKKKRRRKKKEKPGNRVKKKRKQRKQKKPKPQFMGQPAQVIFAAAEKPHYPHKPLLVPTTQLPARRKIKYIIKNHSPLKVRKKQYFKHLFYVIYPFIKFVIFFTVLNPFTLGVFLFSLVSPIVFGGLGFVGLSLLIKPALHVLFSVKKHVGAINSRRRRERRRRERWQLGHRPITVHKHYYEYRPQPHKWRRRSRHNPILPHIYNQLKQGSSFAPNFVRYEKTNYDNV